LPPKPKSISALRIVAEPRIGGKYKYFHVEPLGGRGGNRKYPFSAP